MSDYPAHIEIMPQVHLIRGENRARFPEANVLFIDDEIQTLVDAGSSMANIEGTLKDLGRSLEDLDRIILTHFHIDHKGHAAHIQKNTDCELICHPLAIEGVKTFEGLVDYYGIAENKYYDNWRMLLDSRFKHVNVDYHVTGTFRTDREIDCGDNILIPLHLPGHTIDHTCFGINDLDTLFLVDIDLTRFGPWYGNRVSDIEDFKTSVEKVIEIQPKMGISSHLINPITEGLDDRLRKFRGVFDERESRIMRNISNGIDSIEELAKMPTIYPRIPMDVYYAFEIFMIEKHIELLEKNGVISREDDRLVIQKR
ncbi:MBL fold metallo-hydrolase [Candidatus Thorarchaeota archaeon]|nr:MAG: MBL fold metallo-hydrolase [Candidatus Thorarchaeota archaeon]